MKIVEAHIDGLRPGWLLEQFRSGAHAVAIDTGETITRIWEKLVRNGSEVLPWEAPLADVAANHFGTQDITTGVGDVFYFQPRNHGYIGRKLLIEYDNEGTRVVSPPSFRQRGEWVQSSPEAVAESCEIAEKIMRAMAPADADSKDFKVSLQRLKYQHSLQDFEDVARVIYHSQARWGRLGSRIDFNRGSLNHRMSGRRVSDLLGLLMELPGGRRVIAKLSALMARNDDAGGLTVVERPHLDERYFSALCGDRQTVRTEAFVDGKWCPLPISLDRLIVFPGNLAARAYGIKAILHRVVYPADGNPLGIDLKWGNVTLLIGAI